LLLTYLLTQLTVTLGEKTIGRKLSDKSYDLFSKIKRQAEEYVI